MQIKVALRYSVSAVSSVYFSVLQNDRWRPMNHLNEKDCSKFVDDMAAVGIDLKEFVYGRLIIVQEVNVLKEKKS